MVLLPNYKLVVVIPHFHAERKENLPIIVKSILEGSVVPDVVVVFNNNPTYEVKIDGAICINSQVNLGSSVRYAIGYQMGADFVIGQDDDLALGYYDIERLVDAIQFNPDSIIGFCGADMGAENPYLTRKSYVATAKQSVDVVLGRVSAMSRACLTRYMENIGKYALDQYGNHEDIPACLANVRAGFKNYIIPLSIKELSTGGVGLEFQEDHFHHRNKLAAA
jgi:hypothetical protein